MVPARVEWEGGDSEANMGSIGGLLLCLISCIPTEGLKARSLCGSLCASSSPHKEQGSELRWMLLRKKGGICRSSVCLGSPGDR